MTRPSLALISHGTSSTRGRAAISGLVDAVEAELRPENLVGEVMLGHVDVEHPTVPEVLAALPSSAPVVVVPLLLSPGYHVHHDLHEAIAQAGARDIRLTPTLGPDPRLTRLLAERLPEPSADDEVVLVAAGSSDERANLACAEVAAALAGYLRREVGLGFLAGPGEHLTKIVEQKELSGKRLVLANYLLAPGFFDDLARGIIAGSRHELSLPLLDDLGCTSNLLVSLVKERFRTAL